MKQTIEAITAVDAINQMARQARALCTDIIRQTSLQPYYGKVGGAAMYAPEDRSEAQRRRIAQAVRHMQHATAALYDIAVEGGMTESKVRADASRDYWRTQVAKIDD